MPELHCTKSCKKYAIGFEIQYFNSVYYYAIKKTTTSLIKNLYNYMKTISWCYQML